MSVLVSGIDLRFNAKDKTPVAPAGAVDKVGAISVPSSMSSIEGVGHTGISRNSSLSIGVHMSVSESGSDEIYTESFSRAVKSE